MKKIRNILLISLFLAWQPMIAFALLHKSEDQAIWDQFIETKQTFEKDVHELVAKKWPTQRKLADEHLEMELAKLERKDLQFEYLMKQHPERIDRKKGLNDFADFNWTDEDEKRLAATDKSYNNKRQEAMRLETRYNNRTDRADFEKNLQNVKDSLEYRSMEDRFNTMVSKLDANWKKLKRDLKN